MVLAAGSLVGVSTAAWAENEVLHVTSPADNGPGSLREALEAANAQEGHDTIELDAGLTVEVLSTLQSLDELTITVRDGGRATLSAQGENWPTEQRMLYVDGGITLHNMDFDGNMLASVGLYSGHAYSMPSYLVLNTRFDAILGPAIHGGKHRPFDMPDQPITLDGVTITRSGGATNDRWAAYLRLYGSSSIYIRNSVFTDNRGAHGLVSAESLYADMEVVVENNFFSGGSEGQSGCIAVSGDVNEGRPVSDGKPVVVFRNNVVEDCNNLEEWNYAVALSYGVEGAQQAEGAI